MRVAVVLLSCICSGFAITVHYETSLGKPAKENTLKDIRLVSVNQGESLQTPTAVGRKDSDEFKSGQRTRGSVKSGWQPPRAKSKAEKRRPAAERLGNAKQSVPVDPNHQQYMQKVASQLLMAQKHASLLSDYQKFILNQDQNVKNFVLGQSLQERNPKPFSRSRATGRALPPPPKPEPLPAANAPLQKIVVVTPKAPTTLRKSFHRQPDPSPQATHLQYVTLAPRYVAPQEAPHRVTLLPYLQPQPYYELAVTGKPEAVQIPSTLSGGQGAFEVQQHHGEDGGHEGSVHHDTKYEFMYKVKDHEKNNDFGHKESRTDKTTYGYYYVHLPDGRLETVKYWADKTGYHAKVDYEGEAKHPPHPPQKLHNLLHH